MRMDYREQATSYLTLERLGNTFLTLYDLRISEIPSDEEQAILRKAESIVHKYQYHASIKPLRELGAA